MSGLYDSLLAASPWAAPLFALLIGTAGSLHCAGMCGGLALAVTNTSKDPWFYNTGRLLGYLLLAFVFSLFGAVFTNPETAQLFALIGGGFVGVFLLAMGLQALRGRELQIQLPGIQKLYSKMFKHFAKASFGRSFGMGLSSILLPCALSNGFVLAALSLGGFTQAAVLVLFFWAGTLPAMVMGPSFIRSLGAKAGAKAQRIMGALFVAAGVLTLLVKIRHAYDVGILCFS